MKTTSKKLMIIIFILIFVTKIIQLLNSTGRCTDVYGPKVTDTYDVCINTELARLMNKEVGCTVPWLTDKTNICVEEENRKAAFSLYQDNRRNQQSICKNPCSFSNMYFGPPVSFVEIFLFFKFSPNSSSAALS